MNADEIGGQIQSLLDEYGSMRAKSAHSDLSDLGPRLDTFNVRAQALVERIAPRSSYSREVEACRDIPSWQRHEPLAGILIALQQDVAAGWVTSLTELAHGEAFADVLEMASELLAKNFKDPAAVVAGTVLEAQLRMLSDKAKLGSVRPDGKSKSAEEMNVGLGEADVYNKLRQKWVTAMLAIRNAAAHGQFDQYDRSQVAALIDGVRSFLLEHPA